MSSEQRKKKGNNKMHNCFKMRKQKPQHWFICIFLFPHDQLYIVVELKFTVISRKFKLIPLPSNFYSIYQYSLSIFLNKTSSWHFLMLYVKHALIWTKHFMLLNFLFSPMQSLTVLLYHAFLKLGSAQWINNQQCWQQIPGYVVK